MKRFILVLVPVIAMVGVWFTAGAADRQTQQTMEAKLLHSKALFEGIVTEDFKQVAENAKKLHTLSQSAGWQFRQSTEYQRFTREFARQATTIENAAKNKNIEAATLGYFQMTMSCVNCHRHLKGSQQASVDLKKVDEKLLASLGQ